MAKKAEAGKQEAKGSHGPQYTKSPATRISKDDIDAVAGKLSRFAKDLPQQERDVLGWILTRAQAAPPGEMAAAAAGAAPAIQELKTPLATQLARSVGFGLAGAAKPEVTVIVGWQFRFGLESSPGEEVINPAARSRR